MKAATWLGAAAMLVTSAAALLAFSRRSPPAPVLASIDWALAVHSLRSHANPSQVTALLAADDRGRTELGGTVPGALSERLAAVQVTEAEERAWYDAHRAAFGGRSFDRSQRVLDQLVRIDAVRAELGGTP